MLKQPPFLGNFPVTQPFGANPERYRTLACAGTPLAGHNGVDFALPMGTPIVAVQDGAVLAAGEDAARFGRFVLVGHAWGQSLYAHLDAIGVQKGQPVAAGQPLGRSGNSGFSTGPHLHFGLRIAPFSLADGWCGYSDPAPYLLRLAVPRGAIIGPHIVGGVPQRLEMLRQWQPRMVLVLDPNPDEMRALRLACPNTVIVARVFEPDHEIDHRIRANPQDAARWAHDKVMARMSPAVDYWQFANEVLQAGDGLPLLNQFELERMALAEAAGYKCAILAFSVGNPDLPEHDRMAMWRLVYPAIAHAEEHGHVVALHQYGMPDLWGPDNAYDWYIHRLEHQVLRRLPFKKVQFAITEYGIDGLIKGGKPSGWQTFVDAEGYTDQLLKAGRYLERFSGRVLGYAVYTFGHFSPWGTYDIEGRAAQLLAERSERGTWAQVNTHSADIVARETDVTADPGGGGSPTGSGGGVDGTAGGDQTGAGTGGGGDQTGAGAGGGNQGGGAAGDGDTGLPAKPVVERRLVELFHAHHMSIKTVDERPDKPSGDIVYVIKDVFTTLSGSIQPTGQPGSIPQWARDAYLTPQFLEIGADHHLFAAIIGLDGKLIKNHEVLYWSDGFGQLGDPGYQKYIRERTKESSGWANNFMASGSSFAPDRGESGPWCWAPAGAAEVICGGGLPLNHHVSTFAVWQAVHRSDLAGGAPGDTGAGADGQTGGDAGDGQTGGDTTGGTGGVSTPPAVIVRRTTDWVTSFNVSLRGIDARPDKPQGDVIYLIKDVFTTRDGSWEPSSVPGSLPQWARDAYLKPFGAPDYFDDAGGDHHLFAAVIGLDGKLMRNQEILYWSDGFGKLGDPSYTGYVRRQTKERSGWANIITGPGSSFVPERGESGPWCWAPAGPAEVVCGGGMPAKWHVSFFVVWQAVKRPAATGGGISGGGGGQFSIFLPFVAVGSQEAALPAALAEAPMARAVAAGPDAEALRLLAWSRAGIEYHPASELAAYARQANLGMPVTQVFDAGGGYVAQGFHLGIVYVRIDDARDVGYVAW